MKFELELGPVPCDETCASITDDDYTTIGYAECLIYKEQLVRQFIPASNIHLKVKGFNHDFGRYYEVVASCDEGDQEAIDVVFNIEANLPTNWDEISKKSVQEIRKLSK